MYALTLEFGALVPDALERGALDPRTLPTAVVALAAILTHLGNPLVALGLPTATYWLHAGVRDRIGIDRRQVLTLVGLVFCTVALIETGKTVIDAPRPATAGAAAEVLDLPYGLAGLSERSLERGGDGFPSGHVANAVVLWGGLAMLASGSRSRRRRIALAVSIVAVVFVSRLVLGVHTLIDLVGALAIGGALLLALRYLCAGGDTPGRTFGLATALGAVGVVVAGAHVEMLVVFGAALGGWLAWRAVGEAALEAGAGVITAAVGLAIAAPVWFVVELLASPIVALLAGAAAAAWLVAAPLVVTAVGRRVSTGGASPG